MARISQANVEPDVEELQLGEMEPGALVLAVAAEIMTQLTRHPDAGDTVHGIRQWWLKETRDEAGPEVVESALEELVRQGAIGVRVLASSERFYFGLGRPGSEE